MHKQKPEKDISIYNKKFTSQSDYINRKKILNENSNIICDLINNKCSKNNIISCDLLNSIEVKQFIELLDTFKQNDIYNMINIIDINTIKNNRELLFKVKEKCTSDDNNVINPYIELSYNLENILNISTRLNSDKQLIKQLQEENKILYNNDLLIEYIKSRTQDQENEIFVKEINIETEKLNILPEYLEYIKIFGTPVNLLFDPVLLDNIRKKIYDL